MNRLIAISVVYLLVVVVPASASNWPHDPLQNLPVATEPGAPEQYPVITTDGLGGAIVVWVENSELIFAQRIDSHGNLLWGLPGVLVCTEANMRNPNDIVPDGSGGATEGYPAIWGAYLL